MADLRGGGARDAPRGVTNSYNFMQFSGNFGKIVMLAPPLGSWRPLLGEILDPPLCRLGFKEQSPCPRVLLSQTMPEGGSPRAV